MRPEEKAFQKLCFIEAMGKWDSFSLVVHTIFRGCVFNGHFFLLFSVLLEAKLISLQVMIFSCEWEYVQASATV